MDSGRMQRLPKWAQEYIQSLERRLRETERHVQELAEAQPVSRVFQILRHGYSDNKEIRRYLDHDTGVIYTMAQPGHPRNREVEVTFRHAGDFIEVHAGASISIRPWSGNMVRITPEPF